MREDIREAYDAYIKGYNSAEKGVVNPFDFETQYPEWKLFERGFQAAYFQGGGKKSWSEPREEGFEACRNGSSIKDNPYDTDFEEWGEWDNGFLAYQAMFA